ncbi:hypothetical protein MSUIS_07080 [Mycoplasma suis KI3806]|uniref:Uncharacterized protein n=1 Tax=Mycoplasma suis (strain KI_3806) TaxID=708248 RepID=F0V2C0_MYCS3|nr:hypothetical protein [Mycoplasma suis]CBZ40801.1 hypothetical protein MSUIS_07080 [Mycoplasma suis KI3806]
MFNLGLLTKGLVGLVSLGGVGGGLGSGLGAIFNNSEQPKVEVVKNQEINPNGGDSSTIKVNESPEQDQKFEENISSNKLRTEEDTKLLTQEGQTKNHSSSSKEVTSPKPQTSKKPNVSSAIPPLTEEEKNQEFAVRYVSGSNGSYCIHTWSWGKYMSGAFCYNAGS